MPLTVYTPYLPVVAREEGTQDILTSWQGKYNVVTNTAAMTLTLDDTYTFYGNASVIIRNHADSTDDITLAASGFTLEYSADLGLLIPPGGIGELKRIDSTTWSLYGYLAA